MGFADRHRHWLRAYQHCTRGQPSWFAFRDWQIGSQFTNRTRQPDASRLPADLVRRVRQLCRARRAFFYLIVSSFPLALLVAVEAGRSQLGSLSCKYVTENRISSMTTSDKLAWHFQFVYIQVMSRWSAMELR